MAQTPEVPHIDEVAQRKIKLENLKQAGKNPFAYRYERSHLISDMLIVN
jgi:hypothetical protein